MSRKSGLRVRQHRRREVELPVEFVLAERYRSQVKFSGSSAAVNEFTVRGTTVDVSPGGMGFNCRQFLPRMCEGSLKVFDPTPLTKRADGTPLYEIAFAQRAKVRRVRMVGDEPTYQIGVSFADPEQVDPDIANRMLLLAQQAEESASPRPPGGADE